MKQFMLFAYNVYYPSGGIGDFFGSYDTMMEALAATYERSEYHMSCAKDQDIVEIYDTAEERIVWRNGAYVDESV